MMSIELAVGSWRLAGAPSPLLPANRQPATANLMED